MRSKLASVIHFAVLFLSRADVNLCCYRFFRQEHEGQHSQIHEVEAPEIRVGAKDELTVIVESEPLISEDLLPPPHMTSSINFLPLMIFNPTSDIPGFLSSRVHPSSRFHSFSRIHSVSRIHSFSRIHSSKLCVVVFMNCLMFHSRANALLQRI